MDLSNSILSSDGNLSLDNSQLNQSSLAKYGEGGKKQKTTRICEYCEVKLDNKQLNAFYEMGKTWRYRENEIVEQKLQWYEDSICDIEAKIDTEKQ